MIEFSTGFSKFNQVSCRWIGMLAVACIVAFPASGAIVGDYTNRTILEVYSYEAFGGGDVVFRVTPVIAGCEGGFWLSSSDPGFKASMVTLLLAYQSKSATRVWGHNDVLWTGSSAPTCKLNAIGLV